MIKHIYVTHSKNFNYEAELYKPLKASRLNKRFSFLLSSDFENFSIARDVIRKVDCLICEVTYPTIEIGVEMEWARNLNIPIVCAAFKGTGVSKDVRMLSHKVIEYNCSEDLMLQLEIAIAELG